MLCVVRPVFSVKACIVCQVSYYSSEMMLWICNDPEHNIDLPFIVSFFELFVPVPMNAQCSCCGRSGLFVLCHSFTLKQDSIITLNMVIINQNKRISKITQLYK